MLFGYTLVKLHLRFIDEPIDFCGEKFNRIYDWFYLKSSAEEKGWEVVHSEGKYLNIIVFFIMEIIVVLYKTISKAIWNTH